jgi:putative DNA primase/helicase
LIVIVEGEAKADFLATWNICATCNAGGAGKWKAEHAAFLKDADVVILPDNDPVGFKHADIVVRTLIGVAKRIRRLVLPNLPHKGDIVDWAKPDLGGTREKIDELIATAPDWPPATNTHGDQDDHNKEYDNVIYLASPKIEALARMPKGVKRSLARKKLAKELGVKRGDIDDEIERREGEKDTAQLELLYKHWEIEPWPESVDVDALLRDLTTRIHKHVVCSHEFVFAVALWITFAWVYECATHCPILLVTSAESESGKTTLLGVVSFLAPRAISTVEISEAALYRTIEQFHPSFVIDEFDTVLALAGTDTNMGALRGVINSGHTRGQGVLRWDKDSKKAEHFSTFGPKAIGMIGRKLPNTTLGRSIVIELRRRKKTERIEKFQHEDDTELMELRRRLLRWATDTTETLRAAKNAVVMPEGFDNRRADNWRLLFAIADHAGEEWAEQARAAAIKIEGAVDTGSIRVRLLTDIRAIFYPEGSAALDRVSSQQIVDELKELEDGPWSDWKNGKAISKAQLAQLLKGFSIFPGNIRGLSGSVVKGYDRVSFEDAWERYLPESLRVSVPTGI